MALEIKDDGDRVELDDQTRQDVAEIVARPHLERINSMVIARRVEVREDGNVEFYHPGGFTRSEIGRVNDEYDTRVDSDGTVTAYIASKNQ